jgi:hypothetical protein
MRTGPDSLRHPPKGIHARSVPSGVYAWTLDTFFHPLCPLRSSLLGALTFSKGASEAAAPKFFSAPAGSCATPRN